MSKAVKSIGNVVKKVASVAGPVIGYSLGGPVGAAIGGALGGAISGGGLKGALLGGALGYAGGAFAQAGGFGNFSTNGFSGGFGNFADALANPMASAGGGLFGYNPFGGAEGAMTAAGAPSYGAIASNGNFGLNPATGLYDVAGTTLANGQFIPANNNAFFTNAYDSLKSSAANGMLPQLMSGGLNAAGAYLQGQAYTDAMNQNADAQIQAARIAADAAKFRPVGVTTNFGSSQFGYDGMGNLISAGYALNPQLQADQNSMMKAASGSTFGGAAPILSEYLGTPGQAAYTTGGAPVVKDIGPAGGHLWYYGQAKAMGALDAYYKLVASGDLTSATPHKADRNYGRAILASTQAQLTSKYAPVTNVAERAAIAAKYGTGQAGYDEALAKYNADKAAWDKANPNMLSQFTNSVATTKPMADAAQRMFTLGNQYLSTSPQEQAAKYMADQQALLAAPRADQFAGLQASLQNQGRAGLAIGGNAGQLAANPEMNAYYNALQQQDLGLAAQSTQGGMDYAKFGAGMVGGGGDMLNSMYNVQSNSYKPYQTALSGASTIEGLGQNSMDLGINIGAKGTAANAASGALLANGYSQAGNLRSQADSISPWGGLLSGAANSLQNYQNNQQQQAQQQYQSQLLASAINR